MKISLSLPEEDVAFLNDYAHRQSLESRSAAIREAVGALKVMTLGDMYQAAWDEAAGETAVWDQTLKDGLADETW